MKPQRTLEGQPRKIVGFHLDEYLDWVAELECGHQQHVRHNPPWIEHHWVTTSEGRQSHLGHELRCVACNSLQRRNATVSTIFVLQDPQPPAAVKPFGLRIRELSEQLANSRDDAQSLQLVQEMQALLHERIEQLRSNTAGFSLLTNRSPKQ
jgi:hypothetical protein